MYKLTQFKVGLEPIEELVDEARLRQLGFFPLSEGEQTEFSQRGFVTFEGWMKYTILEEEAESEHARGFERSQGR